ncbi:L-threonylcarbamoyladenylate synthase [candidate division KSB1 bacterium]
MTESSPLIEKMSPEAAGKAANTLSGGGIVVIPTDTFYGLAVDPMNSRAVERLFGLKGRDRNKPLILLTAEIEAAFRLTSERSKAETELARRLWPGPVTIIFRADLSVPVSVTVGRGTVGLRVPASDSVRAILRRWGGPLTAPSANRQGSPPPDRVEKIDPEIIDGVDLVIDDGRLPGGAPSTLLDLTVRPPRVLRPGALPESRIADLSREVEGLLPGRSIP